MKIYLKKVICSILALFLFTVLWSCSDSRGEASEDTASETAASEKSSDASSAESLEVSSEISSEESDVILSEDDVLLMTTIIDGKERYICINKKTTWDYDDSVAKLEEYDFAVLTDINQLIKPTLIRKGETFMNWKIADVSAYFICYEDGRMYPSSILTIKMESESVVNPVLTYGHFDDINDLFMYAQFEKEEFNIFPYPVYTVYHYSPSLLLNPDYKYWLTINNMSEVIENNNLNFGSYETEVRIKELYIKHDQPSFTHYYFANIDIINID